MHIWLSHNTFSHLQAEFLNERGINHFANQKHKWHEAISPLGKKTNSIWLATPHPFFFRIFISEVDNLLQKKKNSSVNRFAFLFAHNTRDSNVSECIFRIFPDGFNSTLQISSRGGICYSFPIGVHLSQTWDFPWLKINHYVKYITT